MNDKKTINVISKIYFIITSFLLFIFLSLCVVFVSLQNGLYLQSVTISNFKAKQLYIKWNEYLSVSIKEIKINHSGKKNTTDISAEKVFNRLVEIHRYHHLFDDIKIDKINYKDQFYTTLKYERDEGASFVSHSSDINAQGSMYFGSKYYRVNIDKYIDKKRDIQLDGFIALNAKKKKVSSILSVNIHDEVKFNLYTHANEKALAYKFDVIEDIPNTEYTFNLFDLDKNLHYWANKAIGFSSLNVENFYGWVDFSDLENAHKNIYINAHAKDLKYKYNKQLDSIHSKTTDLEFKNGILSIYPRDSYTYKSQLANSYVQLDFTKDVPYLMINLDFDGKLDSNTIGILNAYNIKLPFTQQSGIAKTKLLLTVNLNDENVTSQGNIHITKGGFRFKNQPFSMQNVNVDLNSPVINANNMLVTIKDNLLSRVNFKVDTVKGKTAVNFDIDKLQIDAIDLHLDTTKKPLSIKYELTEEKGEISVEAAEFLLNESLMISDRFTMRYNEATNKWDLPLTKINSEEYFTADVNGTLDFQEEGLNLFVNLKSINTKKIALKDKNNILNIHYKNNLSINAQERIDFTFNKRDSFISPFKFVVNDNSLELNEFYLNMFRFKSKLAGRYYFDKRQGYIHTRRLRINDAKQSTLYFNKDTIEWDVKKLNGNLTFSSRELTLDAKYKNSAWSIDLASLTPISRGSELMQKYHFTDGNISLFFPGEQQMHVDANINYPYKLIVNGNKKQSKYFIKGNVDLKSNETHVTINNGINVHIKDKVRVSAKNTGFNIGAIESLLSNLKNVSAEEKTLNLELTTKNSYLYISDERRIISDNMYINYSNGVLTSGFSHDKGAASINVIDNKLYVYGQNFNDKFMEKLFYLSRFKGGKFGFRIGGELDSFEGIFRVEDTIILDYKILNNVLSFVNTIPSLVTFSTPGYSSKGLKLSSAYMKFKAQDDLYKISDIYFNSKELDILGRGVVSLDKNTIDLELNLKTALGDKVSKVPVLGHVLMDKETISTTLKVTGALDNPTVNSLIAKDIVVAPLNILLRTITLPYYLINKENNSTK